MTPRICPRCGGLEVGCPVCDAPPKRQIPFDRRASAVRLAAFSDVAEAAWAVQGIDISAWNGVMDFSITKKKCQFVIVRLGYGNEWKDSRCDKYRQDLIANDIPYGVYWYCKPGQDAIAHATHFAQVASEYPYQLGTEEDYEETSIGRAATLDWIIALDKKAKALLNRMTSPYSSAGFWNEKVLANNYFIDEQYVANWTTAEAPWMPFNWTWKKGCKWQWSADGNQKAKEYGMVSDGDPDMDLDRYFGTIIDFNTRYGTHIKPIGEIPPVTLPDFFTPNGSPGFINIRSAPNPMSNTYIIGRANNGKKWKPLAIVIGTDGKEWWKVNEYAFVAKWLTKW